MFKIKVVLLTGSARSKQRKDALKTIEDNNQCLAIGTHALFEDEVQFKELGLVVDKLNIPVLTYGIRTDFKGELFIGSKYLLAWSDTIKEIKTVCYEAIEKVEGH